MKRDKSHFTAFFKWELFVTTETYHFGCPCVSIFIIMQIGGLACGSLHKQLIVIFFWAMLQSFLQFFVLEEIFYGYKFLDNHAGGNLIHWVKKVKQHKIVRLQKNTIDNKFITIYLTFGVTPLFGIHFNEFTLCNIYFLLCFIVLSTSEDLPSQCVKWWVYVNNQGISVDKLICLFI